MRPAARTRRSSPSFHLRRLRRLRPDHAQRPWAELEEEQGRWEGNVPKKSVPRLIRR